jgi:hypothetical protein
VAIIFSIPLIGWIIAITAFNQTGYRKRDFLLLPILGIIVGIRVEWRDAAKSAYWSPRSDRPSKALFGG